MVNFVDADVVIIGAGPVGMFAVFEAGMFELSCIVIETSSCCGGQCVGLYPDKPIYDIPAIPVIDGAKLIDSLMEQIEPFSPRFYFNEVVESIVDTNEGKVVVTKNGLSVKCKVVIIATGGGSLEPNRPPIDGIESYEGQSVFYKVTDRDFFANKKIIIAGGGDSAADWAIELSKIATIVYLVHRRKSFRCAPLLVSRLEILVQSGRIEVFTPYQVVSLIGNGSYLKQVTLGHIGDESDLVVEADVLLPFFGIAMRNDMLRNWNVDVHLNSIVVDHKNMQTSRSGIYAIGDAVTYDGKLKLIMNGFAEAAVACHSIYGYIYPDKPMNFQYSTMKSIPGKVPVAVEVV